MTDALHRDGHLSTLSLERIHAGENVPTEWMTHLDSCPLCQARLAAISKHESEWVAPPLRRPSKPGLPGWLVPACVAAAALLVYLGRPPLPSGTDAPTGPPLVEAPDHYRVKGSVSVEFFVKRDEMVKKLRSGDVVHPGERLGFRVSVPRAGHLMIVGIDGKNAPYLCYPQNNQGRSKAVDGGQASLNLDEAVEFDDVLGREDVAAIFCDTEVRFDDVADALKKRRARGSLTIPLLQPGCRQRAIHLNKSERP